MHSLVDNHREPLSSFQSGAQFQVKFDQGFNCKVDRIRDFKMSSSKAWLSCKRSIRGGSIPRSIESGVDPGVELLPKVNLAQSV